MRELSSGSRLTSAGECNIQWCGMAATPHSRPCGRKASVWVAEFLHDLRFRWAAKSSSAFGTHDQALCQRQKRVRQDNHPIHSGPCEGKVMARRHDGRQQSIDFTDHPAVVFRLPSRRTRRIAGYAPRKRQTRRTSGKIKRFGNHFCEWTLSCSRRSRTA
jgi:hypothetical protein